MNELEIAIAEAIAAEGNSKEANKAYLEFIKANFMIPIENEGEEETEHPKVLFFEEGGNIFLPVFTNLEILQTWSMGIADKIQLLRLSGVNLLKGIGENVTVSLNIGSKLYKEFNPSEIMRMKSMVLKFFPS
jgi:hypothetical protein